MTIEINRVKHTRRALRRHFIETVLHEFDVERMKLDATRRKAKYAAMQESPYRFFRGSAYLFYYDVTKIPSLYHTPAHKPVWIQGDMHMDNFGCFQNEAGDIVFDANDFDEGYVGSYLYDILRMNVSIALYADAEGHTPEEQRAFIREFTESYYEQLARFVAKKEDPSTLTFTEDNTKKPISKVLRKLEKRKHNHLLADITYSNEQGERVFCFDDEVRPVTGDEAEQIRAVMRDYMSTLEAKHVPNADHFRIKDIARKYGSGTASIGLSRYYILIEGGQEAGGFDDLVLEMKEARPPVPAYFLPYNDVFWAEHPHQGERVVATQKAMHHLKDPYLGYTTIGDKEFYIRERSPYKKKVKQKDLVANKDYKRTVATMGRVAAKIHTRADISESYRSADEILAAIDDKERFIHYVTYATFMYKEQVKYDYEIFTELVDSLQ